MLACQKVYSSMLSVFSRAMCFFLPAQRFVIFYFFNYRPSIVFNFKHTHKLLAAKSFSHAFDVLQFA
jgi:hypothetical protein